MSHRAGRRAALAIVAFVLAGACRGPVPARTSAPVAPAVEQREAELLQGFLQVTLKIPKHPVGRKPAVIGKIAGQEALLARGVVIVEYAQRWSAIPVDPYAPAPQPPPSTEHPVGRWLLAAPRAEIVGRAYFQLIAATARRTLPLLVDWLGQQPEIDASRIAITGSSTNGFVALEALAADGRLAAGVARATCGDYRAFLRASRLALDDDPDWLPGGRLVLDPDYADEIDRHQPISNAAAYPPRPLLLQAGSADVAVPFACVHSTAERLASAYAAAGAPERFRLIVYPDRGHALEPRATTDAIAFLEHWLIEVPAER